MFKKLLILTAAAGIAVGTVTALPAFAATDTEAPSAVLNFAASATDKGVTLSWSPATDNVGIRYYVWQYTSAGDVVDPTGAPGGGSDGNTTTTFRRYWALLLPGQTYHAQVYAVDTSGNRGPTAYLTYQTPKDTTKPQFVKWGCLVDHTGINDPRVEAYVSNQPGGKRLIIDARAMADLGGIYKGIFTITDPSGKTMTASSWVGSYMAGIRIDEWPCDALSSLDIPLPKGHGTFNISVRVSDFSGNISDQALTTTIKL